MHSEDMDKMYDVLKKMDAFLKQHQAVLSDNITFVPYSDYYTGAKVTVIVQTKPIPDDV